MQIKHRLLTEYARMWPREVFDCLVPNGNRKQALVKVKGLEILEEPGVYVLYRDDVPYYIGQAGKLRKRLWHHAEKPDSRYYQFWNYFSVFVVEDAKNRDEIEGILIAAMPTANGSKPKMKKQKYPAQVKILVRDIRRNRANPLGA
jgi:hypothetical protein